MFEKQNQNSGNESLNNQAGRDIIINGLTYIETKLLVKEEALKVFKDNSLILTEEAYKTILSRAEVLFENFLQKLEETKPEAIESMRDPGMQYCVYNAQKEYAKTGDKDLCKLLVDILVERAKVPERNLVQIVLDESIKVAPILTSDQFDALSLAFILHSTINRGINSLTSLFQYFESDLIPYANGVSKNNSRLNHLIFAGCGSIVTRIVVGDNDKNLQGILLRNYPWLFSKGYTLEEIEKSVGKMDSINDCIVPCLSDESKHQIIPCSLENLKLILAKKKINEGVSSILIQLSKNNLMSQNELKVFFVHRYPHIIPLLEQWNTSSLTSFNLTSVGIAIGQANISFKTNLKFELNTWID